MTFRLQPGKGPSEVSLEIQGVRTPARMELAQRVEQLYQDLYDAVYRYLMLTGSNPVDANEYTQEAFLRLFKSLKAGQNIEKPRNWLISVAHNARLYEARKESRNARLFETQF